VSLEIPKHSSQENLQRICSVTNGMRTEARHTSAGT